MKSLIINLLVLIISINSLNAQMTDQQIDEFLKTATDRELVQKNTTLMLEGFFDQSLVIADELLKKEPDNANFNYRKGFAIFNSTSDYSKAIPYLLKGKEKINANSDQMSPHEKSAPREVLYYLGRSYHLTNDIDNAEKYYTAYLDNTTKENKFVLDAQLRLKQCANAKELMATPRNYHIINLGDKINTEHPEYAPIISLDGSVLYFTSRRLRADGSNKDIKEPYKNLHLEDVYYAQRIDVETWDTPQLMDFSLPERNEATVAVSSDERSFYIYKDDAGNGDIFKTEYKDSKFENLSPIDVEGVNTEAWEPHITASPDGKYKYFSSDREGGFGGRDIYRITKLPNGQWSKPMNLGPTINTPYDEDSPFISVDNKTLYFSHNGEKSIGGFDVFVSVLNEEDRSWSDPINLGVPLNSTGDDIYYTTTADGLTGYYTSFRADGFGEKDIYEVRNDYLGIDNIAVLTGKVSSTTGEPIPEDVAFTLKCLNCAQESIREINLRPSDGGFFATIEKCRDYEIIFHHKNGEEEFYRKKFSTDCNQGYDNNVHDILIDLNTMSVITDGDVQEVNDFVYSPLEIKHFFGYNNIELSTATGGLKDLVEEMSKQAENGRTDFVITINASASKVPTRTFKNNMTLANKRARYVYDLLDEYFKNNEQFENAVKLNINKIGVNGPSYSYGTHTQIDKYAPYQYVIIQLNGQSENDEEMKVIKSKDNELKMMPK